MADALALDRHSATHQEQRPRSFPLIDLRLDSKSLAELLEAAVAEGSVLDAFLFAAGFNQLAEDSLWGSAPTGRVAAHAGRRSEPVARFATRALDVAGRGWATARSVVPAGRRAAAAQADLERITDHLAKGVMTDPASAWRRNAAELGCVVPASTTELAGRVTGALRPPSSFRSFDQHPTDLDALATVVAAWCGGSPVAVVGVRTSGSYLAPLLAAALVRTGHPVTGWFTVRPGHPFGPRARDVALETAARRGAIVVVDDPPASGLALAAAARQVEWLTGGRATVSVAYAATDDDAVAPAALASWPSILLDFRAWSIHDRLAPASVSAAIDQLLAGQHAVASIERLPDPRGSDRRGHVRAAYAVDVADQFTGAVEHKTLHVDGVGIGFFGEHTVAVAQALPSTVPPLLGVLDGLAYRDMTGTRRDDAGELCGDQSRIRGMARYVADRHRSLAVPRDVAAGMGGQLPVWEAASQIASRSFGRAELVAKSLVVGPVVRKLLTIDRPSVVDGDTAADAWLIAADGGLRKRGGDDRDFSHLDLATYDAVYDLAGIDPGGEDPTVGSRLRLAYQAATGETVDEERWLLNQLVHLWDRQRSTEDHYGRMALRRAAARATQRYFAAVLLGGVRTAARGPLCALDIDGVLENDVFGFPSPTPASIAALRALMAHGYRPVLVTGRSASEVRERCLTFGLVGGVAEYGAATYESRADVVKAGPDTAGLIRTVRDAGEQLGYVVDTDYRHIARISRLRSSGRLVGLGPEASAALLSRAGLADAMVAIEGHRQTDLVPSGIGKGVGVRHLLDDLAAGEQERSRLAFAVGDTVSDLPMLAEAELAVVPRHAAGPFDERGVRRARRRYQSGLADAVALLLGHRPGHCPLCRMPALPRRTGAMLALLSVREAGMQGLPMDLARIVRTAGAMRL